MRILVVTATDAEVAPLVTSPVPASTRASRLPKGARWKRCSMVAMIDVVSWEVWSTPNGRPPPHG